MSNLDRIKEIISEELRLDVSNITPESHVVNDLNFDSLDNDKIINELTTIKGVGSWTAEMFLIFILFRENIFSKKDIALLNSIKLNYNIETLNDKKLNNLIKSWAPYNTYASLILWKSIEEKIFFKKN